MKALTEIRTFHTKFKQKFKALFKTDLIKFIKLDQRHDHFFVPKTQSAKNDENS